MNKQSREIGRSLRSALLTLSFCGTMAMVSTGCPGGDPDCESGTGTLEFQNTTAESVQIVISDEAGDMPVLEIESNASYDEVLPTGDYSVKATGSLSGADLLEESYTLTCDARLSVVIEPEQLDLTVAIAGAGNGVVVSSPEGIDCGSGDPAESCAASFDWGTQVSLEAIADSGSSFSGWGGDGCAGNENPCLVDVTQARSVTANFDVVELSAPLVTSMQSGLKAQGQVSALGLGYYIAISGVFPSESSQSDGSAPYIGQIMLFAGSFAPAGWVACDGRLLSIAQNTALFSLIGTTYGGDGQATFAVPDLRARVAMGAGAISGASNVSTGDGVSLVPLTSSIQLSEVAQGQVNALGLGYYVAVSGIFPSRDSGSYSAGTFIGEVMIFAGNFAPRGWRLCDGALLPIAQNQALFSLLGTMYGGNGQTTFALPDLRSRVPSGQGQLLGGGVPPQTPTQIPLVSEMALGQTAQGQVGLLGITHAITLYGVYPSQSGSMGSPGHYLGQILLFAGNFTPGGGGLVSGALMPISQNEALFSLLGTTYGGNGQTSFALPNLSSRVSMGVSNL